MAKRSNPEPSAGSGGIKEVASRAGVGIGSVSRVFSNQGNVSEAMRERVLLAADELGYRPNLLAGALRRRATHSVGFVVSDIANPLVASILHGVEAVLSAAGYSLLLTNSGGDPAVDAERILLLRQRRVDGLILLPAVEEDPALRDALRDHQGNNDAPPAVVIDRDLPAELGLGSVLSDHHAGVLAATNHLLELGHRRLGVVLGRDVRPARERLRAVEDAFAALGLAPSLRVDHGPLSEEHGTQTVRAWLDAPQPPTAILLGGNQLLGGALAVVRERGLRLGQDLSLVSCDDVPLGRLFETPVATVGRDTEEMGRAAAWLLLSALDASNTPSAQESITLPTWFEPRGSCGRPVS